MLRVILLALLLATPARAEEITVFAAASLKTALDEIAADWQVATGNTAVLSYGGSPTLAKQIIAAAPADVFLSASPEWMDAVEDAGLLRDGTRVDLMGNRLVLVAHGAGAAPVMLDEGTDLAGLLAGGKLSMAMVDSVPAGQYGKEALEHFGLWEQVEAQVVQSDNVRTALALVALGEAPLGVVYASDAIPDPGGTRNVTVIATFPEGSHRPILYPAALTSVSAQAEAQAFLDHLTSEAARAVFAANGFTLLPADD